MSEVRVGENESLESALKRFKRKCARSGDLAEVRKREHYEKPSVKRRKKQEAARRKRSRHVRKHSEWPGRSLPGFFLFGAKAPLFLFFPALRRPPGVAGRVPPLKPGCKGPHQRRAKGVDRAGQVGQRR